MEVSKILESLPAAKMLLSSLRSVGYTEETAISDIIDNSISAEATKIELYFDWDNERIIIYDNGKGMSEESLLESMKIGCADPSDSRDSTDLGRFGMGMKTASFSLGKKLQVITKNKEKYYNACWDLTHVESSNKWNILINSESTIKNILANLNDKISFESYDTGTLVIISNLDKIIDYNNMDKSKIKFYKIIKKTKSHIAMIFHRFMEEDCLEIHVNKNKLMPWNPFATYNVATQELPIEKCYDGKCDVIIEPYILPHKTKFSNEEEYNLAGGIKGWLNHQGFYVYRNRRLIEYGTWFGKFRKEPAYNLARIKLDMYSESDFEWGIDIKKSKAIIPLSIEEILVQVSFLAIERSVAIYNSRGTYNRKNNHNTTNLKYVWEQRKNSSGNYMFYLNKKHPILLKIFNEIGAGLKSELKTYLSLIENYSPIMLSGLNESGNENLVVNEEDKEKDIIIIKEKILIMKKLGYENEEILDVFINSPEYSYLKKSLKSIIEGV